MADNTNHDELITRFCDLTGSSPAVVRTPHFTLKLVLLYGILIFLYQAQQYLAENQWDLVGAAALFYTPHEGGPSGVPPSSDPPQEPEAYTGPRTLDGRPAPQAIPSVGSSSRSAPPPRRGGFATLESLNQGSAGGHGHGHAHDDDDDSDDEDYQPDEQPRDLFAGGEKSGLAVQDPPNRNDPRKVVNDILKKARA
jgi:UBX domain-containing protein 1